VSRSLRAHWSPVRMSPCDKCKALCSPVVVQVMFFFNNECLLIACNRSWSAACDAVPNKNVKFADAFYLRVRTAGKYQLLTVSDR